MAQAAVNPAHAGVGQFIDLVSDAALVHKRTGQYEQGNGHHHKAVHGGVHQLDHHGQGHIAHCDQHNDRGRAQRDGDGYAQAHQCQKD